jgi:hypothetical protein
MRSKRLSFGWSEVGVEGGSGSAGRLPKREEKTMSLPVYRFIAVQAPEAGSVTGSRDQKKVNKEDAHQNERSYDNV